MDALQLSPLVGVVFALFIVAPEPARDSPTKLGTPVKAGLVCLSEGGEGRFVPCAGQLELVVRTAGYSSF